MATSSGTECYVPWPSRVFPQTGRAPLIDVILATAIAVVQLIGSRAATVLTHVSRILLELGARDGTQLVVPAYEPNLVRPGGQES